VEALLLDDLPGEALIGVHEVAADEVDALSQVAALADDLMGELAEPLVASLDGAVAAAPGALLFDDVGESPNVERFDEEVADAEPHRLDRPPDGGVLGHEDDGAPAVGCSTQVADEPQRVAVGEIQFGDDDIGVHRRESVTRVMRRIGSDHVGVQGGFDLFGDHGRNGVVRLDHQHSQASVTHRLSHRQARVGVAQGTKNRPAGASAARARGRREKASATRLARIIVRVRPCVFS
jgi:hypothetical protein